jgi:hypothetical protein
MAGVAKDRVLRLGMERWRIGDFRLRPGGGERGDEGRPRRRRGKTAEEE